MIIKDIFCIIISIFVIVYKIIEFLFKILFFLIKIFISIFAVIYIVLENFFKFFWMLTGGLIAKIIYVLVGMFGKASTGTAISTLHGAAKTKATFAAIGGGSVSSGGFGMAFGITLLKIICVIPVIIWIFEKIKNKDKTE